MNKELICLLKELMDSYIAVDNKRKRAEDELEVVRKEITHRLEKLGDDGPQALHHNGLLITKKWLSLGCVYHAFKRVDNLDGQEG